MALPLYLAMTEPEITENPLPENLAYMSCHFSASDEGLCDIPMQLPKGSMLILDDQVPVQGHDAGLCAAQLCDIVTRLECSCVLLDFQRPGNPAAADIARNITHALTCPVGVTEGYAADLPCRVFLTAPQPNKPLKQKLSAWSGRELWLEAVLESRRITVGTQGAHGQEIPFCLPKDPCHRNPELCCSYHIELTKSEAIFTISRTAEDLKDYLRIAEDLGICLAVGLYQQLTPQKKNPTDESLWDLEHKNKEGY